MAYIRRKPYFRLNNTCLNPQDAIRFLDPFWSKESSMYTYIGNEFDIMYMCKDRGFLITFDGNKPHMVEDLSHIYITYEEAEKLQKRIDELVADYAMHQKIE